MNGTHKCSQEMCKHGKGPGWPNIVTEHKGITKFEVECTNKLNNTITTTTSPTLILYTYI
jgi:hypothetical protein